MEGNKMRKFEIICVTMNQKDFSKIKEMNIHSDVIFANQSNETSKQEYVFDGIHTAQMINSDTRGVGINRNIGCLNATAEICLFADDDLVYVDDLETKVVNEFEEHPDADVIIFNLKASEGGRPQKNYNRTRRHHKGERMPWGGCRIAVKLSSMKKANLWFSTLYGGGCIFPSGEDSIWLNEAKRKGLKFYVSKEYLGTVFFDNSTWFTGYDAKFFYGKGAYYGNTHPRTIYIWFLYMALRSRKLCDMNIKDKFMWMQNGKKGYDLMLSYEKFVNSK